MAIDRNDPRSPSRQIADDLRTAIRSGEIKPGDRLPSERELVERYDIAPQTARQAVAALKTEGLVDSRAGRGVFVRRPPSVIKVGSDRYARWHRDSVKGPLQLEAEERGLDWQQEILELATEPAPDWVAQRLNVSPGHKVFVRRRRTWIEGSPTQLADSYYRLNDVWNSRIMKEDTGPGGAYARLEERGLLLRRFREEITIRMPNPEEAQALQLGPGIPVAELHRIAYTTERPIEFFHAIMSGERHTFAYDFDLPT